MNRHTRQGRKGRGVAVFLSLLCVLVVGWVAYLWWVSPERAIKRRLNDLGATLSVPANDTELGRVTRVTALRGYLAQDVRVSAGGQQLVSRDVLLVVAGLLTPPPGGLTVELVDVQVTVGPDRATAQVYLDVKMTSPAKTGARADQPTIAVHEANVTMAKRDGEWVITSAASQETLTRP